MTTTSAKTILISGGGIAGPVTGILLARLGWKVTIIERAPAPRRTGQQIDISGAALKIVRQMGLDEKIRKELVHDDGIKFVDAADGAWASFAVTDTGDALVKEYEILRSDLAGILYDASKDSCEWIFEDMVKTVKHHDEGVRIGFAKTSNRRFDAVVIADGLRSRTRSLIFDDADIEIRNLHSHGALLTIPWHASDGTWSRWYSDTGGRAMILRPQADRGKTGAYLNVVGTRLQNLGNLSTEEQKQEVRRVFEDTKWSETGRMLHAMQEADDWYVSEVTQIRCKSITKGRVALLGDAGFAPSPVSGQGTSVAITAAYILAGCLSQQNDVVAALHQYEEDAKPFIDAAQSLPPGVPWLVNPQSQLGVNVLYWALWIASLAIRSGLPSLLTLVASPFRVLLARKEMELPSYPALSAALSEDLS